MKTEDTTMTPLRDTTRPPRRRGLEAWRRLRTLGSALGLAALAFVLWALQPDVRAPAAGAAHAGWGAEAAHATADAPLAWLPMAPANACGLGASSCFKCHNGTRAPAPTSDPAKAPWHVHHAKVNNSCVGCHKGNPRIMKEELAHAKMVAKPRDNTSESCGTCHTADLAKVQGAYTGGK